jgi:phage terminase large subunit-like protein
MSRKNRINAVAARRAIFFIENLKHCKGEWAGKPFKLMRWQRRIIAKLFGTLNTDGTRQYRTCYIELPRKNGKSTMASGVGLYLLFADNEPGAQIYSAANDRDQASLVFNDAAAMVRQSKALTRRSKIVDSQKRIVFYAQNSYYRAISAEAYSKFGYDSHGVIYDELHAAPNRELWDVLTTSFGARRQPLLLCITTAGYDRNSICFEQHDYACKVRDGIIDDPTFLPIIYAAPDDADWTDEKVWARCNPALGIFRSLPEMRTLCAKAQKTPALEMIFRRLYLNQWRTSVERWMPMDKWNECAGTLNEEELKGKPCYAGLDLASTIDLAALSLVSINNDDSYNVMMRFWIPGDTAREKERADRVPYSTWAGQGYIKLTEGNVIDYGYIKEELLSLIRQGFNIKELAFDEWGATKLIQDLINSGAFTANPKAEPSRIPIIPFRQGFKSLSPPTKELMNLVLSKKIRHGGHPVLNWNADNMVVSQDPAANIKPDKAKATQKIDGMVALIMAIDRASRHKGEEESVYETRGVITL